MLFSQSISIYILFQTNTEAGLLIVPLWISSLMQLLVVLTLKKESEFPMNNSGNIEKPHFSIL